MIRMHELLARISAKSLISDNEDDADQRQDKDNGKHADEGPFALLGEVTRADDHRVQQHACGKQVRLASPYLTCQQSCATDQQADGRHELGGQMKADAQWLSLYCSRED